MRSSQRPKPRVGSNFLDILGGSPPLQPVEQPHPRVLTLALEDPDSPLVDLEADLAGGRGSLAHRVGGRHHDGSVKPRPEVHLGSNDGADGNGQQDADDRQGRGPSSGAQKPPKAERQPEDQVEAQCGPAHLVGCDQQRDPIEDGRFIGSRDLVDQIAAGAVEVGGDVLIGGVEPSRPLVFEDGGSRVTFREQGVAQVVVDVGGVIAVRDQAPVAIDSLG